MTKGSHPVRRGGECFEVKMLGLGMVGWAYYRYNVRHPPAPLRQRTKSTQQGGICAFKYFSFNALLNNISIIIQTLILLQ